MDTTPTEQRGIWTYLRGTGSVLATVLALLISGCASNTGIEDVKPPVRGLLICGMAASAAALLGSTVAMDSSDEPNPVLIGTAGVGLACLISAGIVHLALDDDEKETDGEETDDGLQQESDRPLREPEERRETR